MSSTDAAKTSPTGDLWGLLFLGVLAQAGGAGMAAISWPRERIVDGCDPTAVDRLTGRLESCDVDQTGDWLAAIGGLALSAAGSMMALVALIAIGVHLGLASATRPATGPAAATPVTPASASAPARTVVTSETAPAEPRHPRSDLQMMVFVAMGIVLTIVLFAVTIGVLSG
ncbi:hypothetical protein RB608_12055 [Nocardioides sp. LHD-245]|uniref:hypothetical protein n=1 Tax=Nocardioides sp. LHD-245 TaxID=3051387 RepID=UPI0027E1E933|nr:hypothetical protein [Nocardioides sp. LHD-245]